MRRRAAGGEDLGDGTVAGTDLDDGAGGEVAEGAGDAMAGVVVYEESSGRAWVCGSGDTRLVYVVGAEAGARQLQVPPLRCGMTSKGMVSQVKGRQLQVLRFAAE